MKVVAPGKLLLAGAYAVLDGAPALVVAVDRYAVADGARRAATPTPEVLAALTAEEAPEIDASALREEGEKLGLGSSAAMLVASLGVARARRGEDLRAADVRASIFADARAAHGRVQGGGSGVDVAASVHGGVLSYSVAPSGHDARVVPAALPASVVMDVLWCGTPALTTGMRARVDALRAKDAPRHAARLRDIADASIAAIAAGGRDDAAGFLGAIRAGAAALHALGREADAPIIPPLLVPLAALAEADGAAFVPSGAGGGDVFVHLGPSRASRAFLVAARAAGMRHISMSLDHAGVRLVD